jgi:hypothetical protein
MRERSAEGVAKVLEIAVPRLKDQSDFFERAWLNRDTYLRFLSGHVKRLVLMKTLPDQYEFDDLCRSHKDLED